MGRDVVAVTVGSYDRTVPDYEAKVRNIRHYDEMGEFAGNLGFPPNEKTILDIGCGPGHDGVFFGNLGFGVIGVDLSLPMVDEANRPCSHRAPRDRHLPTQIRPFGKIATGNSG